MISFQFCLLRKDFDFRRNSRPTVPLYADRRELLGFRDFFSSLPACRKGFFDTLRSCCKTIILQQLPRLSKKPVTVKIRMTRERI